MTDCPECAPGAVHPHDEPSRPHIHLTDYGYLIYAPDHEQRDFIEEIRVFERRAGREDAAEAVWAKSQVLRGEPFRSGQVGIEYVNGMEDATEIARGGQA